VQTPNGTVHRSSSSSGWLPGILIAPAILSWHDDTVHQMFGPEVFVSTGNFGKGQPANVATGFDSVAPAYWITWFPQQDIEIDGSFVYLFNGKNHETNYRSGQEFSVDYAASYDVVPGWQVGVNGYAYKQITDDKQNGAVVGDGNRGRTVGIGPFIRYDPSKDWGITLKWQTETLVENRAKGNRFFLQFALRLI
jgi:hypothetical protein